MHATSSLRVPVISFLSRSPSSSRQTLRLLQQISSIQPLPVSTKERDALDNAVFSSPFLKKWRFDSASSICPVSNAVLHLISLTDGTEDRDFERGKGNSLSLLSVTGDANTNNANESVLESREILSQHLRSGGGFMLGVKLAMHATSNRYPVERVHILGEGPMFHLPSVACGDVLSGDEEGESDYASTIRDSTQQIQQSCSLREVAIPYFDSITLDLLSASGLSRPTMGLYQWPATRGKSITSSGDTVSSTGIVIRPLPTASEDRILPPPSLVFQCSNLDVATTKGRSIPGTELAKVGFSGDRRGGQYTVRNAALDGLDVRLCDSTELSSSFAEAQEALLSASLDELQSANVMAEGGRSSQSEHERYDDSRYDALNGVADCWIEFRANVKQPSGFFGGKGGKAGTRDRSLRITTGRSSRSSSRIRQRVAKAPDLPYE